MDDSRAFLGRGFRFPPRVDPATGRFLLVDGEEDIRQSIYLILTTRRGERAMLPDFGCDLHRFVFDLPDAATVSVIQNEVEDALARWEPRIIDVRVSLDLGDLMNGRVFFQIRYTVRDTNNPNNLVFPYYLYEGVGAE